MHDSDKKTHDTFILEVMMIYMIYSSNQMCVPFEISVGYQIVTAVLLDSIQVQ